MTKIVGATGHKCYGIGEITLTVPNEENKTRIVDGKQVRLEPTDMSVQHIEDGRTRVICDCCSNGHGSPDIKDHCLKIADATNFACFTVLTGRPVQNGGSEISQKTLKCRWIVPPIDEDENQ